MHKFERQPPDLHACHSASGTLASTSKGNLRDFRRSVTRTRFLSLAGVCIFVALYLLALHKSVDIPPAVPSAHPSAWTPISVAKPLLLRSWPHCPNIGHVRGDIHVLSAACSRASECTGFTFTAGISGMPQGGLSQGEGFLKRCDLSVKYPFGRGGFDWYPTAVSPGQENAGSGTRAFVQSAQPVRQYQFIHPTNSGGTALERHFKAHYAKWIHGTGHSHNEKARDYPHPIVLVRDPFERACSMFRHWKYGTKSQPRDAGFKARFASATLEEYLVMVDNRAPALRYKATWNAHWKPTSHWITPEDYAKSVVIEYSPNLDEALTQLFEYIGAAKTHSLEIINKSVKTPVEWTANAKALVRKMYAQDFELLLAMREEPSRFALVIPALAVQRKHRRPAMTKVPLQPVPLTSKLLWERGSDAHHALRCLENAMGLPAEQLAARRHEGVSSEFDAMYALTDSLIDAATTIGSESTAAMTKVLAKIRSKQEVVFAVIGGSSTLGVGCDDEDGRTLFDCAYTSRLARWFKATFNTSVEVIDWTRQGSGSIYFTTRLGVWVDGLARKPDVVFIDTLTNDAAIDSPQQIGVDWSLQYEALSLVLLQVLPKALLVSIITGGPRALVSWDKLGAPYQHQMRVAEHYRLPTLNYAAIVQAHNRLQNTTGPERLWPMVAVPMPAFSNADVGQTVSITGNDVLVDGKVRFVYWGDAKHNNMQGTVKSIDPKYKGKVELESGHVFENGVVSPKTTGIPYPDFAPRVLKKKNYCCMHNHPPYSVHQYLADILSRLTLKLLNSASQELVNRSHCQAAHKSYLSTSKFSLKPLNKQADLDKIVTCVHPRTSYAAQAAMRGKDSATPTVIKGDWRLFEDRPNKPGWIATEVGSKLAFPISVSLSGSMSVSYLQSYEGVGTITLELDEAKQYPERNKVKFCWMSNTRATINALEPSATNAQTVTKVLDGCNSPLGGQPLYKLRTKLKSSKSREQFGLVLNYTLIVTLTNRQKFKLIGINSC